MKISQHLQSITIKQTTIELFVPDAFEIQAAYSNGEIDFPYWSQVWPSAIALSEFILMNQHLVKNKNIIELGAGLGFPSLTAALFAKIVLCSDKDVNAVKFINKSIHHNQFKNMHAVVDDWNAVHVDSEVDVLLLSDVNYEPNEFGLLRDLLMQYLHQNTTVILSTPQRLVAKEFVTPLLQFAQRQEEFSVELKNEIKPISVLVLQK